MQPVLLNESTRREIGQANCADIFTNKFRPCMKRRGRGGWLKGGAKSFNVTVNANRVPFSLNIFAIYIVTLLIMSGLDSTTTATLVRIST